MLLAGLPMMNGTVIGHLNLGDLIQVGLQAAALFILVGRRERFGSELPLEPERHRQQAGHEHHDYGRTGAAQ